MSWNALGENPVPGEVDAVLRVASTLGGVCDQADLITSRLRVLDGGTGPQIWRGEAATAFRDLLAKIGPDLMKLSTSHHEAQEALRTYARSLGDAQGQARQAEGDAEKAVADKTAAEGRHKQAADEAASQEAYARAAQLRILQAQAQQLAAPLDPVYQASMQQYQQQVGAQRANAQTSAANARSRASAEQSAANAAAARLAAAKKLAHQASMLRDDAARTATRLIDAAAAPGIAHRNIFERTWNTVSDKLRDITASPEFASWMNTLGHAGDVLGVIATVCTFIPFLNVAAGPLFIAAAALKGAAFLGTALAAAYGHATPGQVLGRGIDLAFALIPVAKYGKTALSAAQAAKAGQKVAPTVTLLDKVNAARSGTGQLSAAEMKLAGGLHVSPSTYFRATTSVEVAGKLTDTAIDLKENGTELIKDIQHYQDPEPQNLLEKNASDGAGLLVDEAGDELGQRTPYGSLVGAATSVLTPIVKKVVP